MVNLEVNEIIIGMFDTVWVYMSIFSAPFFV